MAGSKDSDRAPRGACLQLEIDRERLKGYSPQPGLEKPMDRVFHIAQTAAWDTISHGGTFVLVVSAEKITMVQRPYADEV